MSDTPRRVVDLEEVEPGQYRADWPTVAENILLDLAEGDLTEEERATFNEVLDLLESQGRVTFEALTPAEVEATGGRITRRVAAPRVPARRPKPLPETIRWHNDPIHRAALEMIAHAEGMTRQAGLEYAYLSDRKNGRIAVGVPGGPTAASIWEYLCKSGPAAVKMHYALWLNFYEQGEGRATWVTADVAQLCKYAGYKPHHKGGYKPETKRAVAEAVKALFAVEVRATLTKPGPNGKPAKEMRLSGPLWTRGMEAEQRDVSADLFGWEPVALSYQPGQWFTAEYQKAHQYVGKAAAALLTLDNRYDEWAILIGGYLITLARANGYAPKRIRMETILKRVNLAQDEESKRRKSQYRGKAETALDRLAEKGVIQSWRYTDDDVEDVEDWDDATAVEAYYADSAPIPKDDWRGKMLLIEWPPEREKDKGRLERGKVKAIERSKKRSAKKDTSQ